MQNISLCNVIDKTTAKYFTQAKYFTVYDETTMSTLCPLCYKCTEMHNILLCNVIDKTAAKYFTQAKYFTVYDETTMCILCPLYVVNVQKCKIFCSAML